MTATEGRPPEKRLLKYLPLILILLFSAGLYVNTLDNDLTYWDDNRYITDNPRIKDFSPGGIIDIFNPLDITEGTDVSLTEYLPLTTLVHATVYAIGGLDPAGYHAANLLLYLVDIALLYWFLGLILTDRSVVALATLVFAVLPAHVESIAWAAATKDVLSFIFLMLSFGLYIKYTRREGARRLFYVLSVTVFTLGLLAKSLVVTLPVLLMLYDLTLRGRMLRVLDKAPYFVIGLLVSALYVWVNRGMVEIEYLTRTLSGWRLFILNMTVLTDYIGLFFAPVKMNVFYSYLPEEIPSSLFEPRVVFSTAVVLGAAAFGAWGFVRRRLLIPFCVFWFFIAFLPILNIIPSSTIKADRYLFIPSVGLSVLVAAGAVWVYRMGGALKGAAAAVVAAWLIFLSVLTFQRNDVWQNGITLWQDALTKETETPRPHFILGNEYRHRGMYEEAISEYEAALRITPSHPYACGNLGALYGVTGRYMEAARTLRRCLEYDPENVALRLNLARAYMALGENGLAAQELREILRRDPENLHVRKMLGME